MGFLAVVPWARAQKNPHIGYIFPAGGQRGTAVEITVGGEHLVGTKEALISGGGIQARVIGHAAPFSASELQKVTRKLQQISEMRSSGRKAQEEGGKEDGTAFALMAAKAADEFRTCASGLGLDDPSMRGFARFRSVLSNPKRQPNAQISETVTLYLTLSPTAEPGERILRLKTPSGVTNPLYFHVGDHREYREREPNDQAPDTGALSGKVMDMEVSNLESLPVVLNGQVMPGDVDRFRFDLNKGMRLVATVSARKLVPFLADAVPGWFQATLALSDANGNEVAFEDDFRFTPDPVLYYEVPESGQYVLEIRDSIYRGREDFVYRIAMGEEPFVTGIFPLGGPVGPKADVRVAGWNLPVAAASLDTAGRSPGIHTLRVSNGAWQSRPLPFALDTLPECTEAEPNGEADEAQPLELPVIVNGRIDHPGDWDVFRFAGKAGQTIAIEVLARRLASPLDSLVKLFDPDGKQFAVNDDYLQTWLGLTTHHSDSHLWVALPTNGTYTVRLGDIQHKGGADYAYRLRVSRARPDFALHVVPSTINAQAGATVPLVVHAVRRDGFESEIELSLKDMPKGFALGGGRVPAGCDKVRLTLNVPTLLRKKPLRLRLEGRATIGGKDVRRSAGPAEDMMQAFLWRHIVPVEGGTVVVTGRASDAPKPKRVGGDRVKLTTAGTGRIEFAPPAGCPADELRFELDDPPKGIAIGERWSNGERAFVSFSVDPETAKPGVKGNLILNAFIETTLEADGEDAEPQNQRTSLGMLPAIPFEVVKEPSA